MCQSCLPVMYIPTSWLAQYVSTDTFRISLALHSHREGCLDELVFEHKRTAVVLKHKTRTVAEAESDVHVEQQHVHTTNFEMQIIRRHAWRMRLVKDFWGQHVTVFVVFHWSTYYLSKSCSDSFGIRSNVVGYVGAGMTVLRR